MKIETSDCCATRDLCAQCRQARRTPRWLFDLLDRRYGPFRLDAAASRHNRMCDAYHGPDRGSDGLIDPWADVTFCNPPFRDTGAWVRKACTEFDERGIRSVLVLPVGCSQAWFHRHLLGKHEILYPTRRINFDLPTGEPTRSADRDTLIVVVRGVSRVAALDVGRRAGRRCA